MKRVVLGILALGAAAIVLVLGHLAFIEMGREVVTLRTQRPDGSWQQTRLWIVDEGASRELGTSVNPKLRRARI